jgi:hypothetical protein
VSRVAPTTTSIPTGISIDVVSVRFVLYTDGEAGHCDAHTVVNVAIPDKLPIRAVSALESIDARTVTSEVATERPMPDPTS